MRPARQLLAEYTARLLIALGFPPDPDPATALRALQDAVCRYKVPWVVNAIPAADYSYTTRCTYPETEEESPECMIEFLTPVIVTGFTFTITAAEYGAFEEESLPPPTLADIDVRIGRRQLEILATARRDPERGSGSSQGPVGFVPARALDTSTRAWMMFLTDPNPKVSVTFRGRYAAPATSDDPATNGFGRDVLVDCTPHIIRLGALE